MKVIKYTNARGNLRTELDEVTRTSTPLCIVSKNNQVVVMDKAQYDIMIDLINQLENK